MSFTDTELEAFMKSPARRPITEEEHASLERLRLYDELGQGPVDELVRLIRRAEEVHLDALLVAGVDPLVHQAIGILRGALKPWETPTG